MIKLPFAEHQMPGKEDPKKGLVTHPQFLNGHSPVSLEILSKGHFSNASGLYSKEFLAEVPLVETVPGAQDASVEFIKVKTGSAIKKGGKTLYYGTVPTKCPKKFLPIQARISQAGGTLVLPKGEAPGLAMALGGLGIKLSDLTMLYVGLARGKLHSEYWRLCTTIAMLVRASSSPTRS